MLDPFPTLPPLSTRGIRGRIRADVVIVGGGLTGVTLCALLTKAGLHTALVERHRLSSGLCSGVATVQTGSVYQRVAKTVNTTAARSMYVLMNEALESMRREAALLKCPHRETDVYVYAFLKRDLPALEEMLQLEQAVGMPAYEAQDAGGCPFPVERAIVMHRQLTLSPTEWVYRLAEEAMNSGAMIAEHTPVHSMTGGAVFFEGGSIEAPTIILAAGVPPGCLSESLLEHMQFRMRTLCLLQGESEANHCYLSVRESGLQLRPVPGGLLAGWTLGRTGEQHDVRQAQLERVLRGRLPEYRIIRQLFRQEVYSANGLPVIGSLHAWGIPVLAATGYSGFGLTGSMMAAQLLMRLILGEARTEDALFQPKRGKSVRFNHTKRRWKHQLRLTSPRCPHMGCRLRYSHLTRRWECPCHGSSFSATGEIITGPAMRSASVSPVDRPPC